MAASLNAGIDNEPEADLNRDEWDDPDGDNLLMVHEYATEIFDYIKHVEAAAIHVDRPQPSDPSPTAHYAPLS